MRAVLMLGSAFVVALAPFALAQEPARASVPRVAAPATGTLAQAQAQPAAAQPQPAPVPSQPTVETVTQAPAPGGVTTLPQTPPPQPTASNAQAATAASRGYVTSYSMLVLDGIQVNLKGVEGGGASSDVVVEKAGPSGIAKKHLAGIRYDDISVKVGLDARSLLDWIAASWRGNASRKSGSIADLDYSGAVRGEREFMNALVTETTFPLLDAGSKEPAYLTVALDPELVRWRAGSGVKAPASPKAPQKMWLPSSFRFEMSGLDGNKVSRIESFTVRQRTAENPVGELRDYEKEPGAIEFPNLKISLAESHAQTWFDWHDDCVVKGNSSEDKERNESIVLLSPNRAEELGRVNLFNCGIFRLAPEGQEANADKIRQMTAELYCERMELVAK